MVSPPSRMKAFLSPSVARVFGGYPTPVRRRLLELRELIFTVAAHTPEAGPLEETLKWGQPSYVTAETKSGSTIRLDAIRRQPGKYALYFHCQTTLVESFRRRFGAKFIYESNRALLFSAADPVPERELRQCIAAALTYHLMKGEPVLIDRPARLPAQNRMAPRRRPSSSGT